MRRSSTDAEKALWRLLRSRQLEGTKFRRQYVHGPYSLDSYCCEQHLAVEVDGGQHTEDSRLVRDKARTQYLEDRGIRVLRFTNIQALKESDSVAEAIRLALGKPSP